MAQAVDDEKKESDVDLRESLIGVLKTASISDLKLSPKVVVLDAKVQPKQAIEALIQNKIRAAPVVDNGKFIGCLDLRDTIKFALESYHKKVASNEDVAKEQAMMWLTASPHITTNTLSYLAKMRPFTTVKATDSVLAVAEALANGHHIVGVIDEAKKELTNILTQGQLFQQVVAMWAAGPFKLGNSDALKLQSLMEMKYITSPVQSVANTMKAADAFQKMAQFNLSGLAVVDANGKLIHNTSATDIKLWLQSECKFDDTIENFLISIRKMSLDERFPVTMCNVQDSFKRAVQKLQATKYHRMWIIDDEKKPIGVLALTDIFKYVCKKKEQ